MADTCKYLYMDSALYYDGEETAYISGLDHLEGETVYIIADGILIEPTVVVSGIIPLPFFASYVIVGLSFETEVETLPLEMGEGLRGRALRASSVITQVYDSLLGHVSINGSKKEPMFKLSDSSYQLVSGDVRRSVQGGTRNEITVKYIQNLPAPLNVIGTIAELEIL